MVTTKTYTSTSPLAELVCLAIGWDYETRPISVAISKTGRILVTGTLLKPEEWHALYKMHGMVILGRELHVVLRGGKPKRVAAAAPDEHEALSPEEQEWMDDARRRDAEETARREAAIHAWAAANGLDLDALFRG